MHYFTFQLNWHALILKSKMKEDHKEKVSRKAYGFWNIGNCKEIFLFFFKKKPRFKQIKKKITTILIIIHKKFF